MSTGGLFLHASFLAVTKMCCNEKLSSFVIVSLIAIPFTAKGTLCVSCTKCFVTKSQTIYYKDIMLDRKLRI